MPRNENESEWEYEDRVERTRKLIEELNDKNNKDMADKGEVNPYDEQ